MRHERAQVRLLFLFCEHPMPSLRSLLVAFALACSSLVHAAAPRAYVPNEGSATVSVVDTSTDTVVDTLQMGEKPRGIAVSLDGRRLYVSDQTSGTLIVYDLERGALLKRVPLGKSPEAVYLSRDGKMLSV